LASDYADFGGLEKRIRKTGSEKAKKNNDWETGNVGSRPIVMVAWWRPNLEKNGFA